jgi:cholesterol transport system auxiliary component
MRTSIVNTATRRLGALTLSLTTLLLAGCAGNASVPTLYDFGPLSTDAAGSANANSGAATLPALVVADAVGPSWLDSQRMYYRLLYADAQQSRPYAHNHWSATPLQLLSARLKSRIAQAGVKVLSATDASAGEALLRVEVEDFSQSFDTPASSSAQLTLRASLFRHHRLLDQRTFSRRLASASADAPGGAQALARAADAVATDILGWLAVQPPPQQ